jgi:hypothetical protein
MTPFIFPEKLKRENDSVIAEYIGRRAQEKTFFVFFKFWNSLFVI